MRRRTAAGDRAAMELNERLARQEEENRREQALQDYEDRVRASQLCGYEVCDMEPCSYPDQHLAGVDR